MAKYNCPTCSTPCDSPDGCFRHKIKKPLTNNGKGLKRGGKLKTHTLSREEKEQRSEDIERMWEVFNQVWKEREHVCQSCGTEIWGENRSIYHDHLLPKRNHREVMYETWNILLVCFDCHSSREAGFPSIAHQKAIDIARKKYIELFNKY